MKSHEHVDFYGHIDIELETEPTHVANHRLYSIKHHPSLLAKEFVNSKEWLAEYTTVCLAAEAGITPAVLGHAIDKGSGNLYIVMKKYGRTVTPLLTPSNEKLLRDIKHLIDRAFKKGIALYDMHSDNILYDKSEGVKLIDVEPVRNKVRTYDLILTNSDNYDSVNLATHEWTEKLKKPPTMTISQWAKWLVETKKKKRNHHLKF